MNKNPFIKIELFEMRSDTRLTLKRVNINDILSYETIKDRLEPRYNTMILLKSSLIPIYCANKIEDIDKKIESYFKEMQDEN